MSEWRTVPGYDDLYKVTKEGGVWSKYKQGFLSTNTNSDDGYVRIRLKDTVWLLHRLVATVYHGDHENMYVNHIDGDKTNNHADNLEWVTQSENASHCAHYINEQGKNKPSESELQELRDKGYSYSQLAEKYSVCKGTIARWLGYKRSDTTRLKEFETLQNEVAKKITGYTHYYASNLGRVLSTKSGTALKPQVQPNGYAKVGMIEDGKRSRKYVHRLVMAAFKGESDLVVNHIDGNKQNNALENLEYVTQSENVRKSANRKLSRDDYLEIYKLKNDGLHRHEIAKQFSICDSYVNKICRKIKRGDI